MDGIKLNLAVTRSSHRQNMQCFAWYGVTKRVLVFSCQLYVHAFLIIVVCTMNPRRSTLGQLKSHLATCRMLTVQVMWWLFRCLMWVHMQHCAFSTACTTNLKQYKNFTGQWSAIWEYTWISRSERFSRHRCARCSSSAMVEIACRGCLITLW